MGSTRLESKIAAIGNDFGGSCVKRYGLGGGSILMPGLAMRFETGFHDELMGGRRLDM